MSFSDDLKRQHLPRHVSYLQQLGYSPRILAGALPNRDLYCDATDTYFECKADNHAPRNLCIELVGNLSDKPNQILPAKVIEPFSDNYQAAIDFTRSVWMQQPKRRSLGLTDNLERKHLVSYFYPKSGEFHLLDAHELQRQIVLPALREMRYSLVCSQTWESGRIWYSLSMLVPLNRSGRAAAIAA